MIYQQSKSIRVITRGKIKEKAFGKFRFFFADQAQYGEIAESELDKLDDEIEELKEKEEKLKSEVSKLESGK